MDKLIGRHIPMESEGFGWDCPLQVPIEGLETRSFQNWVLRQPVKMGGFGVRSQVELSPAAFVGGLEQAIPHFVGAEGVCQQLVYLQRDATQCAEYLGQDLGGPLSVPVEGAGEGAVDGSTRKKLIQQREELRGAVLKSCTIQASRHLPQTSKCLA